MGEAAHNSIKRFTSELRQLTNGCAVSVTEIAELRSSRAGRLSLAAHFLTFEELRFWPSCVKATSSSRGMSASCP
jgi:hypothetical protein